MNQLMNFSVDEATQTIKVKRSFDAPKDTVWAAWTEPELLDQWWAPEPWRSRTKLMDFKIGGRRLYAMCGPEGEENWFLADYTSISPKVNFKYRDAFCDSEGRINQEFPRSDWSLDFTEEARGTLLDITITYQTLADLEKIIEMGFEHGLALTLNNLDNFLKAQKSRIMNDKLQFDFLVNKKKNTITINREFAGKRQLVWDCYTKSELLDQWFAPKPFTTKTKSMDFREGGHWHYAMVDPEGKEYWGWTEYIRIQPIDYYESLDAFSDSEGNINKKLPHGEWQVAFSDMGDHTLVETTVTYETLEALETVIKMGMEAGMLSTMERLDELLESLNG